MTGGELDRLERRRLEERFGSIPEAFFSERDKLNSEFPDLHFEIGLDKYGKLALIAEDDIHGRRLVIPREDIERADR